MQEFIQFAIKQWYLFLALFGILGLLIGNEVMRKLRGVNNVNPTQALGLINNENAVVLDVQDNGEYKQGHLSDARHIPASSFKEHLGELQKFKSSPIIVYCRTGSRSSGACADLKKNGFEKVYNLSGGLSAWQGANLPVKKK